ncbi:MAG: YbaK/EbsC family protein [Spirochaetaceae bacterium]|nr:YbaK/EbsC family protein [Spirochaetaceae bacterium]
MPTKQLMDFLDQKNIKYVVINHSSAYTASEIAASAHIKGQELAKTVMVKIDGKMNMVVLPAKYRINFDLLKKHTGSDAIELADEDEFTALFPDCLTGAMPPFGNIYGMKTFLDKTLTYDEEIAFNAGNHSQLIRLGFKDFLELVKPDISNFAAA